jgi:hypothetical protein
VVLYRPVFSFNFTKFSVTYVTLLINKSVIEYCIGRDKESIFMVFACRNGVKI